MIYTAPQADRRLPSPQASLGRPLAAPSRLALGLPLALGLACALMAWRMGPALQLRLAAAAPPAEPRAPSVPTVFTPEVRRWERAIVTWSAQYALPAALIATVMQIESCGDARAVSGAGAQGLFQVMPFHFKPGEDPGDPQTNARRGLAYLARALELSEGRVDLALAGYNGGLSRISQAPDAWPAETQRYVAWGSGIFADVTEGRSGSPALQAWLEAGGARLCRAAAQHS